MAESIAAIASYGSPEMPITRAQNIEMIKYDFASRRMIVRSMRAMVFIWLLLSS